MEPGVFIFSDHRDCWIHLSITILWNLVDGLILQQAAAKLTLIHFVFVCLLYSQSDFHTHSSFDSDSVDKYPFETGNLHWSYLWWYIIDIILLHTADICSLNIMNYCFHDNVAFQFEVNFLISGGFSAPANWQSLLNVWLCQCWLKSNYYCKQWQKLSHSSLCYVAVFVTVCSHCLLSKDRSFVLSIMCAIRLTLSRRSFAFVL